MEYWDKRYQIGGTSGYGSVGPIRDKKWSIINQFLPIVNHIIDVGCGDLSFWEGKDCNDYTGIDLSPTVIEQNRKARPKWVFKCQNASERIEGLSNCYVFCLDLLYHIMNDNEYLAIIENLCSYSKLFLFVYTLIENPYGERKTDGIYQKYRDFNLDLKTFEKNGFKLISVQKCQPWAAMHVFFNRGVNK